MPSIARSVSSTVSATAAPIAGDASQPTGVFYEYTPGSHTFRPTKAGYWKIAINSGAAVGNVSQASGSYSEATVFLDPSQTVSLVIGTINTGSATTAATSTATLPGGRVLTALGPNTSTGDPGTATGGDVNLDGSAAGAAGLGTGGGALGTGGGAPGQLPFRGGAGGANVGGIYTSAFVPGGGAGSSSGSVPGGHGLGRVMFVRN